MIEEIFPKGHHHYTSLPLLGPIMDEFAEWLTGRGYTRLTVRAKIKEARQIDVFFRKAGIEKIFDLKHDNFDQAWKHYCHSRPNIAGTIRCMERCLEGCAQLAPRKAPDMTPAELELELFLDFLRRTRGLSASTLGGYSSDLRGLLAYMHFGENNNALAGLSSKDVEGYVRLCSERMNRYSMQHLVAHLRAWLKYQYEQGGLKSPLHTMIDTPRVYRLERPPRSLPREKVEELLASVDRTDGNGIRDYTILFLSASYGLRPCEIVKLTLDDIDWQKGVLHVPQQKTGNYLLLPLTDLAREVLVDYLKRSRPDLPFRELFLRMRAPQGPLKPTAVTEVFQLRALKSGLDIPYKGPYCLRHSCAVHLLRQGADLKSIGDLLGHRNPESTCAYLGLDIDDLREVALAVPVTMHVDVPLKPWPKRARETMPSSCPVEHSGYSKSFLVQDIEDYVQLKQALGRGYRHEARILMLLEYFLASAYPQAQEFSSEMFNRWAGTLSHLSPTARRNQMRIVRNLCLYRARTHPDCYIPDPLAFPARHQPVKPYILKETDVSRLLGAAQLLQPSAHNPLRSQTFRLAIILLYTTGIRRGELLGLKLGDFDQDDVTLSIQATKFHKSRIIPLPPTVAEELACFLILRDKLNLPMEPESPLIWNSFGGEEGKAYSPQTLRHTWSILCDSLNIFTTAGRIPRIHDLRHSFAVNALLRWYDAGEDVNAKLPSLSTYMGHVSIASTHYYLSFVDELRCEADARFEQTFGAVIKPNRPTGGEGVELIGGCS